MIKKASRSGGVRNEAHEILIRELIFRLAGGLKSGNSPQVPR